MFDRNLQKRQLRGRAANRAEPLIRHFHKRSCWIHASRIMGPQAITVASARRSPHKHLELAILDAQKRTKRLTLGNKRRRARQHPSRGPVPRDARVAIPHKPAKCRIVGQADIHGSHNRFLSAQITSQTSMTPPSYTTLARISHTAPPNLAGRLPIHLSSRSNSALTKPEDVPLHPDQFHKSTEAKLTTSYSPLARTCKHRNHRPETESSKCKQSKNAKDEKQRPRINLASRRHCPAWLP